ncbi:MAG TPA: hypothetical protein PKB14_08350 [Rubrivivax sp.]|nr:hypothetical protein [Rubrivivax sp.]
MFRRLPPPLLRRPLAAWLVCAMLLAQMLGLAHRIAHAGGPPAGTASAPELHVSSLFDTHHDAADCRLFDQASHADAPGCEWAPMPSSAQPQAPAPWPPQPDAAAAHGAYLARGPPARA